MGILVKKKKKQEEEIQCAESVHLADLYILLIKYINSIINHVQNLTVDELS